MNEFMKNMKDIYNKSKNSIENSYRAFENIDDNFQVFLIEFFKEDTNKNLFLTQIFYSGDEYVFKFQDYLFNKACNYFSNIIRIDGLEFYFNSQVPLSNIDFIISGSKIASVNIFFKHLIVYERSFFESIDKGIKDKEDEIELLNKKYNFELESLSKSSFLTFEKDEKLSTNIINSTILRKKAKKERFNDLEAINYEILSLESELAELLVVRDMLARNLVNIKYFQEKIVNRISSRLHYNIIND